MQGHLSRLKPVRLVSLFHGRLKRLSCSVTCPDAARTNHVITRVLREGRFTEARKMSVEMPLRDLRRGMFRDMKKAEDLFAKILEENNVTWVLGFIESGFIEKACLLFDKMPVRNTVSYNTILTGLIKAGQVDRACELFNEMPERNVTGWTCIISGYKQMGMNKMALSIFHDMLKDGASKPNQETFVCVLGAISNLKALFEGLQVHQMVIKTQFESDSSINSALVNMYKKCGEIGFAQKVFDLLPERDSVPWNGIIPNYAQNGAFLNRHNLHLKGGIDTYTSLENKLLEVEPDNSGTYTLLSNIYASAGKFKEAAKIRARMKERGLKKQPGCSWIEIGNRVHVFVVRDKSHCESNAIYDLVHDIHDLMRINSHEQHDHLIDC